MASQLNRPALVLNLAAFVGVSVFSISTDAPIIQQDILKRSEDALLQHHIPIRGLGVSGRDVTLSGAPGSPITAPAARSAVEEIGGVRLVTIQLLSAASQSALAESARGSNQTTAAQTPFTPDLATPVPQISPLQRDVQARIDSVLESRDIAFKPETAVLLPEGTTALDTIASYLAASPSLQCQIRGFDTEPTGTHQNWVLAFQRALATEDYLETKGISDWRLSTRAFHAGDSTDGRPTSRAVDLVVRTRE